MTQSLGSPGASPRVILIGGEDGGQQLLDRALPPGAPRPVIIGRLTRMEDFLAMGTDLRVDLVLWSSFPEEPDEVGLLLQQVRRLRSRCGVLLTAPPAMQPRVGPLAADLYARRRRGEIPPAWITREQDLSVTLARALAELGFPAGRPEQHNPGPGYRLAAGEGGPLRPRGTSLGARTRLLAAPGKGERPSEGGTMAESGAGAFPGHSGDRTGIVVCFGPKGGVGKTTLAAALAVLAGSLEGGAALVDLDLTSPDTAVHLDAFGGPDFVDMLPQLSGAPGEAAEVSPMEVAGPGTRLGLVAGPSRPELAELIKPHHVERLLKALAASWPTVIVDTPAGFGDERVFRALDRADVIVLVTSPDPAAVRQAALGLELLQAIDDSAGDRCLLVINKAHPADAVTVGRIEDFIGREAAAVIPRDRAYWERAVTAGRSLWSPGADHPVAAAVASLGARLGWAAPPPPSPLARWLRWLPWAARPIP